MPRRCADDPHVDSPFATREQLEAVAGSSGDADPIVGDVREQAVLDHAIGVASDRFGGLDAAVAVAGCPEHAIALVDHQPRPG